MPQFGLDKAAMSTLGFLRDTMMRFQQDRSGNVLIMLGFLLLPLLGMVGVAIDYSRATNARAALNAAIDSAALMAAHDAPTLTSDAQLTARINAWVKDNLPADIKDKFSAATVSIDRTARTIRIEANANVPTTIARVLGSQNSVVSSTSQSTWGTNTIELALVLDNTGSMASSGKMAALRQASLDLIKIMKDATQRTDQIKISIVPFSTRVILDTSLKSASWLRWDLISKANWQGCVADRDKSYDTTDGDGASSNAMRYPADICDKYSPATQAKVLPLTSDWTALNARVNAMQPGGATNIAIGAVWGMATLSPSDPFTEAKPATTPFLKKYMILLTDGDNTKNRWDGDGANHSPAVDLRTTLACDNIKAAGVTLYTIRVIDGNATLLRNCASEPGKYFDVSAASQLGPIFKAIASEISQIRLTQ